MPAPLEPASDGGKGPAASIASIAAEAGVSIPTVSKVLNGRPDVAADTRARVESIIEQHQYRRRRSRRSTRSELIDLVFHELHSGWATEIICGVEQTAATERVAVVLSELGGVHRPRREWFDLNELPQFVTEVEGQPIHFAHIRSAEPTARPLLMVHGWPSSFVEFVKVVGPLTDPVAHGGKAEDAVHLVLPSIPGYGFSPVTEPGWGNLFRVAAAFAEVMTRLGYDRFLAQGTDVGSGIVGMLSMVAPGRVIASHINGPAAFPFGPPLSLDGLEGKERERAERFNAWQQDGSGYLHLQATRPQTLSYGLTDSPVAQLAWIVEKFKEWTDSSHELPEDAVDLDQLLTNVSIYWFNELGWSAAHSVYEGMEAYRQFAGGGSSAFSEDAPPAPPTGVAVFEADLSVRRDVDPANAYTSWNEYDSGGHFPAMEVPELLVDDIRTFFRSHQ